jgi:hypothetical protein
MLAVAQILSIIILTGVSKKLDTHEVHSMWKTVKKIPLLQKSDTHEVHKSDTYEVQMLDTHEVQVRHP